MSSPEHEVAPDPSALIESMRAFGYALPTAIADLIDNSISAGAQHVEIKFRWAGGKSYIAVVDDGSGMTEAVLTEAMRLGSRSPVEERASSDLGRFGLGLKSAAWSQGRSLTVITTRGDGPRLIRRWDLDHVSTTGRWLLRTDASESAERVWAEVAWNHGTAVIVENLDRLVGDAAVDDQVAQKRFFASVDRVARHLGMVFHRFMTGTSAVKFLVNGEPVRPWDPFLASHPATQQLQTETLSTGAAKVVLTPYVLPHFSKLAKDEHERAGGGNGWNAQQGFYVYRGKRLLVAGSWLGLRRMQQEEHYKLARIRVDLDNTSDEAWQIDVRKERAQIPGALTDSFARIAQATRKKASDAYRFRGKNLARRGSTDQALAYVWRLRQGRGDTRTFIVNRDHPVVVSLMNSTDVKASVEQALKLVEENLPVASIVMDAREHPDEGKTVAFDGDEALVLQLLTDTHTRLVRDGQSVDDALSFLAQMEPFQDHPAVLAAFRETFA